GGLPRGADRMADPAPSGRDLRVAEALRLPLHLVLARTCEHGMGVGIDESRGDDLSRRLDPKIGARMPSEHLVRRPDVDDSRAFRVHGAILEDPQVLRSLTGARSLPAAKGEQFRRVHDQERRRRRRPFPEGGTDLVGVPLHPSLATPRESAWTTNASAPAERIASAVLEGRSVSANMLPPAPAPVSLAPQPDGRAAETSRSRAGWPTPSSVRRAWFRSIRCPTETRSFCWRAFTPSRVISPISRIAAAAPGLPSTRSFTVATRGPVAALMPVFPITKSSGGRAARWRNHRR